MNSSSTSSSPSSTLLISSALFVFSCLFARRSIKDDSNDDSTLLRKAHSLRLSLSKPPLSQFRVVAILVTERKELIFGTNVESYGSLTNTLCAERAACSQYILQYPDQETRPFISTIYIVSDADVPISPGCLCREFLSGQNLSASQTRIVMQSADTSSKTWVSCLQELFPRPSLYNRLNIQQQLELGTALSLQQPFSGQSVGSLSQQDVLNLWNTAWEAAKSDVRDKVFPMHYGAAALIRVDDGIHRLVSACALKAVEYGSSQDALCQLWTLVSKQLEQITAVILVDQFGLLHTPAAVARSIWAEYGGGSVPIILYKYDNTPKAELEAVPMESLAPYVPKIW
ncbi:hypothetical protein FisN_24Lh096 [Fistulifera solaris]|uniref:CMP/dCMP-type deaminase domain-containing protein n=1 Tax=Fistulifera solaris TaxID=1519565 RepID=A0A1Z5K9A1_FISSO|nr:hypothetical protein FisN_24Lh096 [Fistulifera solaris]|eukprot:GAX22814.1 hypothetical protein FisN_24Lh096 [Fistulifera solaris]